MRSGSFLSVDFSPPNLSFLWLFLLSIQELLTGISAFKRIILTERKAKLDCKQQLSLQTGVSALSTLKDTQNLKVKSFPYKLRERDIRPIKNTNISSQFLSLRKNNMCFCFLHSPSHLCQQTNWKQHWPFTARQHLTGRYKTDLERFLKWFWKGFEIFLLSHWYRWWLRAIISSMILCFKILT